MSANDVSADLILASASPRRRELLKAVVPRFIVRPCPLDEPGGKPAAVGPRAWAAALAYFKARAVAEWNHGCWVLGADTIVACEGQVLGKPQDAEDARRMLELQAGRMSEVITGLCVVRVAGGVRRRMGVDVTRVWMRADLAEIEAYVRGGDWQGKAGAYGIQDVGDRLIERIEGSFSNVVGLPVEMAARLLRGIAGAGKMGPGGG